MEELPCSNGPQWNLASSFFLLRTGFFLIRGLHFGGDPLQVLFKLWQKPVVVLLSHFDGLLKILLCDVELAGSFQAFTETVVSVCRLWIKFYVLLEDGAGPLKALPAHQWIPQAIHHVFGRGSGVAIAFRKFAVMLLQAGKAAALEPGLVVTRHQPAGEDGSQPVVVRAKHRGTVILVRIARRLPNQSLRCAGGQGPLQLLEVLAHGVIRTALVGQRHKER